MKNTETWCSLKNGYTWWLNEESPDTEFPPEVKEALDPSSALQDIMNLLICFLFIHLFIYLYVDNVWGYICICIYIYRYVLFCDCVCSILKLHVFFILFSLTLPWESLSRLWFYVLSTLITSFISTYFYGLLLWYSTYLEIHCKGWKPWCRRHPYGEQKKDRKTLNLFRLYWRGEMYTRWIQQVMLYMHFNKIWSLKINYTNVLNTTYYWYWH